MNDLSFSPTIVSYPDYSAGNDYQKLLYRKYRGKVHYGEPETALRLIKDEGSCIFHVNWLNKISTGSKDEFKKNIDDFQVFSEDFRQNGGRIVWTVHNLYGHNTIDDNLNIEQSFRGWLLQSADLVFLHKASHLSLVCREYSAKPKRVYFHPHGLYDLASDYRNSLNINVDFINTNKPIIGFVGQLRPYKGLNEAVEILENVEEHIKDSIHILIAGHVAWEYREVVSQMVTRLQTHYDLTFVDRRLNAEELFAATAAAQLLLLPYTNILNSGSLRYNQTIGTLSLMPIRHQYLFIHEPGVLFYENTNHAAALIGKLVQDYVHGIVNSKEQVRIAASDQLQWPDLTNIFRYL